MKHLFKFFFELFYRFKSFLNDLVRQSKLYINVVISFSYINIKYTFSFIKSNRKRILLFILGILLISRIIYRRLVPRDSVEIIFEYNGLKIWLYSYLILINILLLLYIILEILLRAKIIAFTKPRKYRAAWNRELRSLLINIVTIPSAAFRTVYKYTFYQIPQKNVFLDFGGKILIEYYKFSLPIIIISMLFCQVFVAIMLAIDIFYFHKFNYFYKSLILLLYPLGMKSILYALKDYAEKGHSEMEEFAIPSYDEWTFIWREDKLGYFSQDNFNRLIYSYVYLYNTLNTMKWISYYMDNYRPTQWLNIFKHSLYILCWGYLLFNTIILFYN